MKSKDMQFDQDDSFLITGGAGFIGSNLTEAILQMGCKVKCLDNLSTGKLKNIEPFFNNSKFIFINGDIRDAETCMEACRGVKYVLHQAAWGSVPRSIIMPIEYGQINIMGTLNMLEASKNNMVEKFIYASSSSVYGDEQKLPKIEGIEGKLLSPYAVTKKVNEEYGRIYTELYGIDTYGLRYFNVFGKKQDPDGAYAAVIPKFIKQLLNNERPVINGDGKQSRDFTYIGNVIEANLKACKASHEAAGMVYNIAFGEKQYLIDVYNDLCNVLNKDIKPIFADERMGDIRHSHADISKAKELLGYSPKWDFKKGIYETIGWYESILTQNTQ